MADALCGPSNPLQQFKQQTQFDRTLQQDRLASRQAPTQGFRSVNPDAGLLDPEFEAFQAGLPPSELPQFHPFQQRAPDFAGPAQAPSWATDFQRMQISPTPTFQQQQQQHHVLPHSSPMNANWAQGFREHISQSSGPSVRQSASSPQAFQYMARYGGGMNGFQQNTNFAQPNHALPMHSKGKEAATEQFDEAAFERAFNQASDALTAEAEAMQTDEMVYERGASTGNYEEQDHIEQVGWEANLPRQNYEDLPYVPNAQEMMPLQEQMLESQMKKRLVMDAHAALEAKATTPAQEDYRVRQAALEEQEQRQVANDDDALAQTAQELLEKVEHNQTDKFRNSQFLSLMRKLRDREVKVEGNNMVETSSTNAVESSAPQVQFDNTEQTPQALVDNITGVVYDGGRAVNTQMNTNIPPHEQDHDTGPGRSFVDRRDGQEVVDLLNSNAGADDIGTSVSASPSSTSKAAFPDGVFYGDLRQPEQRRREREMHQISEREVWDVPLDWKR